MKLGLPVSESSTRTSKVYVPTGTEHKFNKMGIENWFVWDRLDLEPAVITNTLCSTTNGGSLKVIFNHL